MAIDPDLMPLLDAIAQRIADLEGNSDNIDLNNLKSRVSALESAINVPINPNKVIQIYDDDSEITYEKSNG